MAKKIGIDEDKSKLDVPQHCLKLIIRSVVIAFRRMFNFSGRTSRGAFWVAFILFGFFAVYSLACEIWAPSWNLGELEPVVSSAFKISRYFLIYMLFPLFVRRLHDVGVSIGDAFNPFNSDVNTFGIIHYLFEPSDPKVNQFGAPHSF